jgi:hypothetical protein
MLFKIASFSRLLLLNIVGAAADEDLAGGPFGGKSTLGGKPGLPAAEVTFGALVGWADFRCPEELELGPELMLVWLVVAFETVLLVVLDPSEAVLEDPDAVKVKVKNCSSSVAQTDTIICAWM